MVIFQDDEVLLESSSEVRPSHLVGVFQGNAVKVLIRSQLQDAVNEAEGLDVVVGVGVVGFVCTVLNDAKTIPATCKRGF